MEFPDKIDNQNCPGADELAEYLSGGFDTEKKQRLETHICDCKACLDKVSIALKADTMFKEGRLPAASSCGVKKTSGAMFNRRKKPRLIWPFLAALAFALSFVFPRYFMQCLTATVIFAIKWVVESENMRTLILVLDSWRKRQHSNDEEITDRLAERGKSKIINDK